jgi:ATP-dependent helicase/nuclease subunit A
VRLENRRLLYVGLTRAQRWLIVCGAGAPPNGSGESWHGLVAAAMARCGAEAVAGPDGDELRLALNWREAAAAGGGGAPAVAGLPGWVLAPAGRPAEGGRLVSPSGLGGALAAAGETPGATGGDAEAARRRGTAVHRLLEHLHGRPAAERAELARRLLPGDATLEVVLAEAAELLDNPEVRWIFGPGSLAEVELAAPVAGGWIGGRVDRLVVEPGRVLAIDFKSNRLVPERAEAVPEGILRQLGAYRAALGRIWRDRPVETAVLWTRSGRLMPVPAGLVDAAFARATLDPPRAGS